MVKQFGWEGYQNADDPHRFTMPRTTVGEIAAALQAKTGARAIRVVGDPQMAVTRVALLPGASGEEKQVKALEQDGVDLLVAGEAREWETVPYVEDAAAEGRHKALILLGHEVSEEATGCQTPVQHAAAMAEARRLRGQTAYDGFPSFGEPYGPEYDREVEAQSADAATRPAAVKH